MLNKQRVPSRWYLAWGDVNKITGATWQDESIAIFSYQASQMAFSPSKRFLVIGDVWLSERTLLLKLLKAEHQSDLELIAIAWEYWGVETFTKLVGMFCLVIWDLSTQTLKVGRDSTGSRTIYYTTNGLTRWIAGDLSSLTPYHSKELDLVALRDYLCCAFVPGYRTMWQNVRELRPGTILSLPEDKIETYWQLQEAVTAGDKPLEWHGDQLRTLLDQVVQEYVINLEAVGVFLSGGLDSSCITALVSRFYSKPVHTYSIHFGQKCPNELEFSSLVAKHCATSHHILEITFSQMWEKLPEIL